MNKLSLWFSADDRGLALSETLFIHPQLERAQRAIRGAPNAGPGYGSFRWSAAVQAMSVFFLRCAARATESQEASSEDDWILKGSDGSYAASLDYAIAKQTNWVLDVFGVDHRGSSLIRRLVARANPERKKPGPVCLRLVNSANDELEIYVFINGEEVRGFSELRELERQIVASRNARRASSPQSQRVVPRVTSHDTVSLNSRIVATSSRVPQSLCSFLREIFCHETKAMLRETEIFNRRKLRESVTGVLESPFFRQVSGGATTLISELDAQIDGSMRLGMERDQRRVDNYLRREVPLRIAVDATSVPSIVIFEYLRQIKGYHFELDYRYADTTEMVKLLLGGSFPSRIDACVLSIAAFGSLHGKTGKSSYLPLMLMPKVSHRVLARGGAREEIGAGTYLFMTDLPGTSSFYFEDLVRRKVVDRAKTKVLHMDPDEVLPTLEEADDDYRAILFFPHYYLNRRINGSVFLDDPRTGRSAIEHVLLTHESIACNTEFSLCLDIAIRDAWLSIQEDERVLHKMIDSMLCDDTYLSFLARCCGLHTTKEVHTDRVVLV